MLLPYTAHLASISKGCCDGKDESSLMLICILAVYLFTANGEILLDNELDFISNAIHIDERVYCDTRQRGPNTTSNMFVNSIAHFTSMYTPIHTHEHTLKIAEAYSNFPVNKNYIQYHK